MTVSDTSGIFSKPVGIEKSRYVCIVCRTFSAFLMIPGMNDDQTFYLYQDFIFYILDVHLSTKMAVLASYWPIHFELLVPAQRIFMKFDGKQYSKSSILYKFVFLELICQQRWPPCPTLAVILSTYPLWLPTDFDHILQDMKEFNVLCQVEQTHF